MESSFQTRSITLGLFFFVSTIISGQAQREFGVDVSHYQGESGISQASWNQMYAEGKRFAFIKSTEGLSGPDDAAMATNMVRATTARIRAGVYHFAHPENRPTPAGAVLEADHFLEYSGTAIGPGFLRPVLDLEGSAANLTTAELSAWTVAFCDRVKAVRGTNAAPIIYCNQGYANVELDSRLAGYDLWLRTVTTAPNFNTDNPPSQGYANPTGVFGNWSFWQYSASGSSGGISPLDLNVCHSEFKTLDSFLIPDTSSAIPPTITVQPLHKLVSVGDSPRFTVSATGTAPLIYQWRLDGTNLSGATQSTYTQTNALLNEAGGYSVVITNAVGSITSSVAALVITVPVTLFEDNFDSYPSSVVTTPGSANGYNILFAANSGPEDFKATFGFNYAASANPVAIPPAPRSTNGSSKGLALTVNKDATAAAATVNLYPSNQSFSGNFALKFDMWINWIPVNSTEQALFGINHSASVINRIGQATSDGLFFSVSGDGGMTSTSATVRDYAVYRGGGSNAIPVLLLPTNTTFGPAPLLGAQFDNANSGLANLFPSKPVQGYPSTPAGSAGFGWVSAEVRQENNLLTWLLNDAIVAQYTNSSAFTNGNILLGYCDHFDGTGSSSNFVIFDNVRVEAINADSDTNGLPDLWEVQFFGRLGVESTADADGDNSTNLREYLAGTNPTNAASAFRMLSVVQTNNDILLSWSTVGGRSYKVQSVSNSDGSVTPEFLDISPTITMTGTNEGTANYLHSITATNRGTYYRVRLVP